MAANVPSTGGFHKFGISADAASAHRNILSPVPQPAPRPPDQDGEHFGRTEHKGAPRESRRKYFVCNWGWSALKSSSIATYSLSKDSGPLSFSWLRIRTSGP